MAQTQLPGVLPFLHKAKINGTFDLSGADMAQVEYHGRVMLVLLCDVDQVLVKNVKGDDIAHWTLKGADASIVRDPGMKSYLGTTLGLDSYGFSTLFTGDVPVAPEVTHVGVYDEEGAFVGLEAAGPVGDHGTVGPTGHPGFDPETGEILPDNTYAGEKAYEDIAGLGQPADLSADEKDEEDLPTYTEAVLRDQPYRRPSGTQVVGRVPPPSDPRLARFIDGERATVSAG